MREGKKQSLKKETQMSEWMIANWEYVLLGFYVLEKIVKLSPSKKDDIIFDSILKPIFNMFSGKK
jgi:hypothetical protein